MKIKTWEKIYWGVVGVLFVFSLFPLFGSEEKIPVKFQGRDILYTKSEYLISLLLTIVIIFVPIWVVVRLIVNKGWSE